MPWTLWKTYREAWRMLRLCKPDVLLSKAGGITIPVCLAARRLHIPIVLHESDAVQGRATRFLSRWASAVCYGFPTGENLECGIGNQGTEPTFKIQHAKFIQTGNPIRPDIAKGSRKKGLSFTGLSGKRPILLVLGGSQGALAINDVIARRLDELLAFCDVAHVTGPGKGGGKKRRGYWHAPIVYDELPDLLAIADVALSRGGMGSIGELAACMVPTIICPLRGVGHDHQQKNAEAVAAMGGCVLLDQGRLDADIVTSVRQFLHDPVKAKTTAKSLHSLYTASASRHIAKIMMSCIAIPPSAA